MIKTKKCQCGRVANVQDKDSHAVCCYLCLFKGLYYERGLTDVILAPDDHDDNKVHVLAHLVEATATRFCRN